MTTTDAELLGRFRAYSCLVLSDPVAKIPLKSHLSLNIVFELCPRLAASVNDSADPTPAAAVVQKKQLFATFLITRDIVDDLKPPYLIHTYPSSKEVCGNEGAETRKRPLYLSSSIHGKESRWFRMINSSLSLADADDQGSARGSFAHNLNGKDNGWGCKVGGKKMSLTNSENE